MKVETVKQTSRSVIRDQNDKTDKQIKDFKKRGGFQIRDERGKTDGENKGITLMTR